jgi:hypothetical protein
MPLTTRRVILLLFSILVCPGGYAQGRLDMQINQGWQFEGADIAGGKVSELVDLPHTWNAADGPAGFDDYRVI